MGVLRRGLIIQVSIESKVIKTNDEDGKARALTADGFVNFISKLGISPGQPQNTLSAGFYSFNLMTRNRVQLEAAYRGSWVSGAVVDCVAEDMTRAGITISTNEAADNITKLNTSLVRLKVWQSICSLIKWSRLYGGAIGVLQIEGQKLDTPLNKDSVAKGQFKGIGVYDRWQLNPDLTRLITEGADIGLPAYYNIVLGNTENYGNPPNTPNGQIIVHHSRCIRMVGIELPFWQALQEMMWGESFLERFWDRLLAFDTTTLSAANLVDRASVRNVKVDGLRRIISSGGAAVEGLVAMFEMVRQFQSNEGLTLLDKDDEFETNNYTFAGLPEILLQFAQQVSGAAGIPLMRLFGQSPAGLNANGDGDIRMYYDNINAQQESRLRNPMNTVLDVVYRSTFGEPMPLDLDFDFTPLWQMSAKDKSDIAKTNTESIIAAYEAGAIDLPTMMLELRDTQGEFGLFGNITDEMIEEARSNPPMPDEVDPDPIRSPVKNLDQKPNFFKRLFNK